jgi:hypothetical protein
MFEKQKNIFKFCLLFLLICDYATAQYYFDSTYIKKYYNNAVLSLYQNYSNHSLYLSQKFIPDTNINTKLNPIAESLTDVGVSYSNEKNSFSFNLFSVPYQPSKRKPQPKAINFLFGIISDNKFIELGVNWFTGYYENNSKNFIPGFNNSSPFYSYNKLKTTNVFYNSVNFSNKRKFSYGAVYRGNALQKKSAAAFINHLTFNYNRLASDSAIIPFYIRNSYDKFGQMNKSHNVDVVFGGGVSGTLVIKNVFFTNITLMLGPGLQYQNYSFANSSISKNSVNVLIQSDIRYSIGFNFKHLYLISSSIITLKSYSMSKMDISSGHLKNQFTLGLRFKRKEKIF